VGRVSGVFKVLRHEGHVAGDAGRHQRLDVHVLAADPGGGWWPGGGSPVGVLPCQHGHAAGGAGRLDVVLVEQHPRGCQLLEGGAVDPRVVPRDIVPAWSGQR
jgi:hypothetical protein